jgi:hypothetical protein
MNYASNYYKNGNHEFENFFASYTDSEELIKTKQELDRLHKELEEKTSLYTLLLGKRYNKSFTPYEKETVLLYEDRNRNRHYFDVNTGIVFTGDVNKAHIIELGNRSGRFGMLVGYCYDSGAVLTKRYEYSIQTGNKKVALRLLQEDLIPMFENTIISMDVMDKDVRTRPGYSAYGLEGYSAKQFINTFFGINKDLQINLDVMRRHSLQNKSFEVIIKTCDDNQLMNKLLQFKSDKAKPIHELIGCSKADMKLAQELGVFERFVDFKIMTSTKDRYNNETFKSALNKTDKEWIEIIEKVKHWEDDLRFYTIRYGNNLLNTLIDGYIGGQYPFYCTAMPKYYPFGKFCSYVVEEAINQGYTSITDFIKMLSDYIRMCEDLNVTPTLYSSYLHQTHDIVSRNHKIKLEEAQEEIFQSKYKGFKPWVHTDYTVVSPKTSHDLQAEGDALNHCVASYIKRVVDGECEIYFLRLTESPDKSLVTFEVRNKQIVQARGLHNRAITDKERNALIKYANDRKIVLK